MPRQRLRRLYVGANSKYTGNSSKAWYLLSEPSDLPVIEVAFLNGQESPTIETSETDFNVLGIQMRGYHDFGVALQDPRGMDKATLRQSLQFGGTTRTTCETTPR